jgi:hypothetical protein
MTTQTVIFEYTGYTSLIARGFVTREAYHFPEPFARVAVDARDREGMRCAPNVREVTATTLFDSLGKQEYRSHTSSKMERCS